MFEDIRQKIENTVNKNSYNIDKFVEDFNKYEVGDTVRVHPDFHKRTTILVENLFNIDIG